jgi:tetratricopeptide (TPR) repeat protein
VASSALLLLVGLLYVLLFGGLSLARREGLSTRFAVEAVAITVALVALAALTGFQINLILFLALLYVATMRVRLLVDLGNLLAQRGDRDLAARVYRLALRLWPDDAGRLIVQINQGVLNLQRGNLDEAIATFNRVLSEAKGGYLGLKHECGCRYNLGVAYERKGLHAQATAEFNAVLNIWPASEYAHRAEAALQRRRRKSTVTDE